MENRADLLKVFYRERYDSVINLYNILKRVKEKPLHIEEISAWLKNANREKNLGFYLDLDVKNNKWVETDFTKEKFTQERQLTAEIFEIVLDSAIILKKRFELEKEKGE